MTFGYFRPTKIAHLREAQALLEAAALRLEQGRALGTERRQLGETWTTIETLLHEKDPTIPYVRHLPRCFGRMRGRIPPWRREL